jgi:hypothetical protein
MKLKYAGMALATALSITFAANTAALAQDISASHLSAARAAVGAIGATDEFDGILPQAALMLKNELTQNNPDQAQLISRTVDEKALGLAGRRSDLENEAATAFARVFSEEELAAITEFYTSEAGRKLIEQGPVVTREVLQAANIWQAGIMRDLATAVGTELQGELANPVEGVPAQE